MGASSVEVRGVACFRREWVGVGVVKPVNVVVGKNNVGKSKLLDLVQWICQESFSGGSVRTTCDLPENVVKAVFPERTTSNRLNGPLWDNYGKPIVGRRLRWTREPSGATLFEFQEALEPFQHHGKDDIREIERHLEGIPHSAKHALAGKLVRRLSADRDVRAEPARATLDLGSDGTGATNLVRKYSVSGSGQHPREIVQEELRAALNLIMGEDSEFQEVRGCVLDDDLAIGPGELWEIYLREADKGEVRLSSSGSGLKTVMLVLLNLLVVPHAQRKKPSQYVFCFEELENNLHPAVLRRLLAYVEDFAVKRGTHVFVTTHSATAVDMFAVSSHAQIVHMTHDGHSAQARIVATQLERRSVVAGLGARPSDLLQANGILWVEGPSDRYYINRWIEVATDGKLREGVHYQCAFYGGALLSHVTFDVEQAIDAELANLLRLNHHVAIVCDSDKAMEEDYPKARVQRVRAEFNAIPGSFCWVTAVREIENYLPGEVLQTVFGGSRLAGPSQYERVLPPKNGRRAKSYWQTVTGRKTADKVEVAAAVAPHLTRELMEARFDWLESVNALVKVVEEWNR